MVYGTKLLQSEVIIFSVWFHTPLEACKHQFSSEKQKEVKNRKTDNEDQNLITLTQATRLSWTISQRQLKVVL